MKHEQAREEGAERPAHLSKFQVLAVSYGAQWEPSRQALLSLPELPDQLWGNARNAPVWVEDPYRGGGPSPADGDATRQLAGYRMLQEFLPPPYTPPGAMGHDWFEMEQLQVADLLGHWGDPALIPALHETLERVWQVEPDAPVDINQAWTEHWWLYQDELAYALGQFGAFDAFAGLDVSGARKRVWMVNLALGYFNAKACCRNNCIGLIGDPVSAVAYQELYPFLIQVLQQHIGLSREEATAYVQGYGSDYFSRWDTPPAE